MQQVLSMQVAAINAADRFVRRHEVDVVILTRLLFLAAFLFAIDSVTNRAFAGGLGSWVTNFKDQTMKPVLQFATYVLYAGGVLTTGVGINKFIQVSKQQSHTSPVEATAYSFGGGALMGIGYIADTVSESMAMGSGTWAPKF